MATSTPLNCSICSEPFNEETRCPRNLPCGHHLCTGCIDELISSDSKSCPYCREDFEATSSSSLMINYGMLDCIKLISSQIPFYKKASTKASQAFQNKIKEFRVEASMATVDIMDDLEELKKDTEKLLKVTEEVKEAVGTESTDLTENVMPRIQSVLTKIDNSSTVLETASLKLKNRLKDIEKKGKVLSSAKKMLDSASSLEDTAAVVDEVDKTNMSYVEWVEYLKQLLFEEEVKIQEARKDLVTSKRIKHDLNEALKSKPEDETSHFNPVTLALAEKLELSSQITTLGLWEMNSLVRRLVERGRLFGLHQISEQRKSARITIENDKLHLYSLKDETAPQPNSHYLPYEEVRRLASTPFKLFMDLSAKGLVLGRILISMNDNQVLDYLPLHITGGKGFSYVDMPIQVNNRGQPWERVIFGRPMPESQSGEWPAYNINLSHVIPGSCGSLVSLNNGLVPPLIGFSTGPYVASNATVIGEVTDGLQVVRDALRYITDLREITVKDCGLILSTLDDINEP